MLWKCEQLWVSQCQCYVLTTRSKVSHPSSYWLLLTAWRFEPSPRTVTITTTETSSASWINYWSRGRGPSTAGISLQVDVRAAGETGNEDVAGPVAWRDSNFGRRVHGHLGFESARAADWRTTKVWKVRSFGRSPMWPVQKDMVLSPPMPSGRLEAAQKNMQSSQGTLTLSLTTSYFLILQFIFVILGWRKTAFRIW